MYILCLWQGEKVPDTAATKPTYCQRGAVTTRRRYIYIQTHTTTRITSNGSNNNIVTETSVKHQAILNLNREIQSKQRQQANKMANKRSNKIPELIKIRN